MTPMHRPDGTIVGQAWLEAGRLQLNAPGPLGILGDPRQLAGASRVYLADNLARHAQLVGRYQGSGAAVLGVVCPVPWASDRTGIELLACLSYEPDAEVFLVFSNAPAAYELGQRLKGRVANVAAYIEF